MRVLETEVTTTYSMGKKNKHKLRKSKENEVSDSSEDVSGRGCVHVSKSVNFSLMKKTLAKQVFGECGGCAKEGSSKKEDKSVIDDLDGATSSDFIEEVEPTLWVCLQCGHQGCGRNSPAKHALKHYETPRSSQHNVVINMSSWTAWCYECDEEVLPENYKKVSECMEHLKKLACVPLPDIGTSKKGSSMCGPSASCDPGNNKGRPVSGKGATSCQKVMGLSNLGNTCFFNAVLQNLIQTYSLENLMGERKKGHPLKLQGYMYILDHESSGSSDEGENIFKDLPSIEISISDPGPLTHALVVFLHEMNSNSRSSIINPSALFGQVCKKAPRFKGMQQQDSHELLRYLMDNMKTEEIKRGQTGILKHFRLNENSNPKKVDEDTKIKVKAYGSELKHTFVECLFGGQLISTVVCEECKYISQVLEPFLDLSLPVTEEKPQRPSQTHGGRKKDTIDTTEEQSTEFVKEEKLSKHQSKKQKKSKKKEVKKQGSKNKIGPVGNGMKVGEDQEEKTEETEDKDDEEEEGDGKCLEQEERYDASDADVEDNLESDTSRCYKNLSDSVVSAQEDSTSQETRVENFRLDLAQPSSTLTVETKIENHSATTMQPHDHSTVNGPNSSDVTNHCLNGGDEVSVSYTFLVNGDLTVNNSVSADYTVHDNEISKDSTHVNSENSMCNQINSSTYSTNLKDGEKTENRNIDKKLKNGFVGNGCLMNGPLVNGYLENEINGRHEIKGDVPQSSSKIVMSESCTSRESIEDPLTDITSGVSTLSLGQKSLTSLSSELSGLTVNGDVCDNISEITTSSQNAVTDIGGVKTTDSKTENGVNGIKSHDGTEASTVQCKPTSTQANCPASKHNKTKELQKEGQRRSINTLADRYHVTSGECSIESCLHQFTAAELLTGNNKFGCKNCTKQKYKNHPNKDKKEMVYSNANKQYLIFQPPAVLTLHLKRFEQVGFSSRKVNRHVDFPFVLDIASYCSSLTQGVKPGQKKILYSLYGVVEHSGRLTSGHYTAYVKVRPNIGTLNNFLNKHNVTLKEYLHKYAQGVLNGEHRDVDDTDDVNTEGLVAPGRWYHISDSRVNEVTEASVERAQAYLLFYERIY